MAIRLEDIDKSPLSKPAERAGSIEEIRFMANNKTPGNKTPDRPIVPVSPDIRIVQTRTTSDQETTIEITSHDITDLKMILEDIGYGNHDGILTRLKNWYKDIRKP